MLISHLTLLLLPLLPGLSTAAGSRGPARAPAAPGIQWACAGPGLACAGGAPEEEKPAEEAGESEAPAAPALRRVAVIGASASDGFGLAVKLPAAFESLVRVGHEPLLGLGDSMFFTRPRSTAEQQVEEALAHGPSLVLGLDYLFWMAYGNMPAEYRSRMLEVGLGQLERFECPLVISTLPDMSAAVGFMLTESQVPSPDQLESMNKRILAWAEEHGAIVVDLAELVGKLAANEPFQIAGKTWPTNPATRLLLPDNLHPTTAGLAAMLTVAAQQLVEAEVVPSGSLLVDVEEAFGRISGLEQAAIEERAREREERRRRRREERAADGR